MRSKLASATVYGACGAKLVPISVSDEDNFVLDRAIGLGLYDHTIAAGQTDAPPPGRLFASTVDGLIYHRLADGSTRLLDNVTSEYGGDGHTHSNKTVLDAITAAFTTADETKLDGIESGATADQSGSEIVALINANLGSSTWQNSGSGTPTWGGITGTLSNQTDLQTALDGKAASGHTHASLHTHSNQATLDAITAAFTTADETKLDGIETGATADLTGAEIVSLLNGALSGTTWQGGGDGHTHSNKSTLDATTASFTSALLTKLNGIESGASQDMTGSEIVAAIDGNIGTAWKDAAVRISHVAGDYCFGGRSGNLTLIGLTGDYLYLVPFLVEKQTTWTTLGIAHNDSGTIRLGIYSASQTTGVPVTSGGRILHTSVLTATGIGQVDASISQALAPGFYWLAVASSGLTVRGFSQYSSFPFQLPQPNANFITKGYSAPLATWSSSGLPTVLPTLTAINSDVAAPYLKY